MRKNELKDQINRQMSLQSSYEIIFRSHGIETIHGYKPFRNLPAFADADISVYFLVYIVSHTRNHILTAEHARERIQIFQVRLLFLHTTIYRRSDRRTSDRWRNNPFVSGVRQSTILRMSFQRGKRFRNMRNKCERA